MDELNELENSKSLNAIRIRKAYIAYLTQEVKEIDEKLKDETLSEDEKSQLAEQRKALEESARKVYSIKNPTDEEIANIKELIAKKYDAKKLEATLTVLNHDLDVLESDRKQINASIKVINYETKKVNELKELQEYLALRTKKPTYAKIGDEEQIASMVKRLETEYPNICGPDNVSKETIPLNTLTNQKLAIDLEISYLKKDGKSTKELEELSGALEKFIDDCQKKRVAAIEEAKEYDKNKEIFLINFANIASSCRLPELKAEIAKVEAEVKELESRLQESEAMLVVNADEETKQQKLLDEVKLQAKRAELQIYRSEENLRKLPKEMKYNTELFNLFMKREKAKLATLDPQEREKRAKELKNLELHHKYLYGQDFTKIFDNCQSKIKALEGKLSNKENEIKELNARITTVKEDYEYVNNTKNAIKEYETSQEILNTVDTLKAKTIENFQGKEFNSEDIKKFLEEQEEFKVLKDNPDKDKIEDLLINEITNACKKQKATNPRKDLKTFAKAAAIVASGFATGMVLSCVPGVSQVRMLAAGLKLAGNAIDKGISIYNSKHQDKKRIRTISQVLAAGIDNLPPKIKTGLNFIKEKLSKTNVNLFINGVSAGYITGNVVELVTGKTVLQNIGDKFKSANAAPESIASSSGTASTGNGASSSNSSGAASSSTQPATPKVPELDIPTDAVTSLNIGEVYDLSNIPQGYIASGSEKAVNLLTQAGKKAILDKTVTVNGKVWCSFLQPDGKGYAWIPEDVVKSLGKVATEVGKGITR